MHVVLDRLPRCFARRLKQRPDINIPAKVSKTGGDNLLAAVMSILTHLGDQDARTATL